jgi:hypothetical protein
VRRQYPPLTVEQILAWADAYRARTGSWPNAKAGPVPEALGQTWNAINMALYVGHRGLPGGDTLARLLGRLRPSSSARCWVAWTFEEDNLVRSLPAREAARRTGRSLAAVYSRRRDLGVGRRHRPRPQHREEGRCPNWTPADPGQGRQDLP